jgi:hypothetical protein
MKHCLNAPNRRGVSNPARHADAQRASEAWGGTVVDRILLGALEQRAFEALAIHDEHYLSPVDHLGVTHGDLLAQRRTSRVGLPRQQLRWHDPFGLVS